MDEDEDGEITQEEFIKVKVKSRQIGQKGLQLSLAVPAGWGVQLFAHL